MATARSGIDLPYGITAVREAGDIWSTENKFGYNSSVGTSYETVWDGGSVYEYISTVGTAVVTSTDTGDDNGGTVLITGLDQNYELAEETLEIGGAAGTVTWSRVFRAQLKTSTTSNTNSGTVTVTVDSIAVAQLQPSFGQTLMAIYTIPKNYQGYVVQLDIGSSKDLENEIRFITRQISNGNVWNTKAFLTTRGGFLEKNFAAPILIPEMTDIEVQAKSSATSSISATFELILEKMR